MATHRLTAAERKLIRAARSARRHRYVKHGGGLAEHAYDAAGGNSWLALDLAIEVTRKRLDIDFSIPHTRESKAARRRAPTGNRLSYEELMKSA